MSTYEISKSSLVSLKAEILRKHQELAKAKSDNERKIKLIKKNTPLEFKNKNNNKNEKESTTEIITESEEVQVLLNKSRWVLEQKSLLYERLRSGQVTEEEQQKHKHFLVQFNEKNTFCEDSDEEPDKCVESENDDIEPYEDDNSNPAEKWVDYVDCLGRTRKCLQKDLEYLKSKDKELEKIVETKNRAVENYSDAGTFSNKVMDSCEESQNVDTDKSNMPSEEELLSSDMRRELLRKQWEKEEEELRNKSDIHYQDVLFGEARTHGVGYYGFSKNEDERLKQQEALKQLREETEQKQRKAQELKSMRDTLLAARIKAAKDRRRARLGLPSEEEEEEEPKKIVETKISEEERQKQLELERLKEENEKLLEEARKNHLRPWDVGKEGITTEHHEMSQEEWNEMKRSERFEEFAPPTKYTKDKNEKNTDQHKTEKRKREKKNKEWRQERASLFQNNRNNIKNSFGLIHIEDKKNTIVTDSRDNITEEVESRSSNRRGAEISPPMNFDYFGPTSSKVTRTSNVKNEMNESIEAGLRFLRNQIENKRKPPKEVFYS